MFFLCPCPLQSILLIVAKINFKQDAEYATIPTFPILQWLFEVITKGLWDSTILVSITSYTVVYFSVSLTFPSIGSLLSFMGTRYSFLRTFNLAGYSAWGALALGLCLANCLTFLIPFLKFYLHSQVCSIYLL